MRKMIDNGTTVLLADDGMMLTDDSSFGTTVRLGKEADETAWREITMEEYEQMLEDDDDEPTESIPTAELDAAYTEGVNRS